MNSWQTRSVTRMPKMLSGAISFNQNINSWPMGSVADMSEILKGTDFFSQPLDSWQRGAVTKMTCPRGRRSPGSTPFLVLVLAMPRAHQGRFGRTRLRVRVSHPQ